jgi:hypothetical protein
MREECPKGRGNFPLRRKRRPLFRREKRESRAVNNGAPARSIKENTEATEGLKPETTAYIDAIAWRAWTDDGDMESFKALFGERGLIVRGYRLGELDRDMSLGKRAGLRQHTSKVESMLLEDGNEPIIAEIEVFPSIQEMVKTLKGDQEK